MDVYASIFFRLSKGYSLNKKKKNERKETDHFVITTVGEHYKLHKWAVSQLRVTNVF